MVKKESDNSTIQDYIWISTQIAEPNPDEFLKDVVDAEYVVFDAIVAISPLEIRSIESIPDVGTRIRFLDGAVITITMPYKVFVDTLRFNFGILTNME